MRWLLALVVLIGLARLGFVQSNPSTSYWLKAEPFKNEPGARVIMDGSTVYTLYEKIRGSSIEKWRITLPERPIHTWVTGRGEVWVLADTTSMFGGPMGGRSAVWARKPDASLTGTWRGDFLLSGAQSKGVYGMAAQCDVEHSGVFEIGDRGDEQFKLALKNGHGALIDVVNTQNAGVVKLVRHFAGGQAENDPLEKLIKTSRQSPVVTEILPNSTHFHVWQDPDKRINPVLELPQDYPSDDTGTREVKSVRSIVTAPKYVVRTPYGRMAWFEFTSDSATLRFLNYAGTELQSVDLRKLGKYASGTEAEEKLNYRSIRGNGPYGWKTLEEQVWSGGTAEETFSMTDRNGREFSITLTPAKDGTLSLSAIASTDLDRVSKKEPSYSDATLQSETVKQSDDGKFSLRMRDYLRDGKPFTQLTLLSKVSDPLKGAIEIELWSAPSPLKPLQTRISNSGRVYAILHAPKGSNPQRPEIELVMLYCWDIDGKTSGGYDLAGYTLKWFASDEEALKGVDLSKIKISFEGDQTETEIEGVPFRSWPYERLDFALANGTTRTLFVKRMNEFTPPMFILRHLAT